MSKLENMWADILSKNPSQSAIRYVIRYVDYLHHEAVEAYLQRNPTNQDLCWLLRQYYGGPHIEKAAEMLLARNPRNHELRLILKQPYAAWRKKTGLRILEQQPTYDDLVFLMKEFRYFEEEIADTAAERLLQGSLPNAVLRTIVAQNKKMRLQAAAVLFAQEPSDVDCRCIIEHVPSLKSDAMKKMSENEQWRQKLKAIRKEQKRVRGG